MPTNSGHGINTPTKKHYLSPHQARGRPHLLEHASMHLLPCSKQEYPQSTVTHAHASTSTRLGNGRRTQRTSCFCQQTRACLGASRGHRVTGPPQAARTGPQAIPPPSEAPQPGRSLHRRVCGAERSACAMGCASRAARNSSSRGIPYCAEAFCLRGQVSPGLPRDRMGALGLYPGAVSSRRPTGPSQGVWWTPLRPLLVQQLRCSHALGAISAGTIAKTRHFSTPKSPL